MASNFLVRRSWLVVPAHDVQPVKRAQRCLPDVIVLDTEYSVPPKQKQWARASLERVIQDVAQGPSEVFVRIDWDTRWSDVKEAVNGGLRGIVLPGPELAEDVKELDLLLNECEHQKGISPGSTELALLLESAKGFWNAFALATASPRITALGLGRIDLTMRLGPDPQGEFRLYPYLMSRTLVVARALHKQPLGAHWRPGSRGGVVPSELSFQAARRAWQKGFSGCLCAEPEQVAPVTSGFTPLPDEVKKAERIVEAFERAKQAGEVQVNVDGHFYDTFKARLCQDIVLFAQACAVRDREKSSFFEGGTKQ